MVLLIFLERITRYHRMLILMILLPNFKEQPIFVYSFFFACRIMYWPRGRVWGGSSALNAMVYIRGHAYDYDRWEREGAKGWSYADCLPYFKKSQTHTLGKGIFNFFLYRIM